jgi:fucose permease
VIIPKLKELFTLNYTQAMLIQFCFFTAYLVIGFPARNWSSGLVTCAARWPD